MEKNQFWTVVLVALVVALAVSMISAAMTGNTVSVGASGSGLVYTTAEVNQKFADVTVRDVMINSSRFDNCISECKKSAKKGGKIIGAQSCMFVGLYGVESDYNELNLGGKTEYLKDGCPYISKQIVELAKRYGAKRNREDSSNSKEVVVKEGDKIYRGQYFILPEYYPDSVGGYLMKVVTITNSTTGYSNDRVTFEYVSAEYISSGERVDATLTGEGTGTVTLGGLVYNVKYYGATNMPDENKYITLDFPQTNGPDTKMIFGDCLLDAREFSHEECFNSFTNLSAKGYSKVSCFCG